MLTAFHGLAGLAAFAGLASATLDIDRQLASLSAMMRAAKTITNAEWRDAFAAKGLNYAEPRLVFLRRPQAHPGHGARYGAGIIVIDLDEAQRLSERFGPRVATVAQIIVAHEFGHHVQVLLHGQRPGLQAPDGGVEREVQADCLAGWSIERSNIRSRAVAGAPLHMLDDEELAMLFAVDLTDADAANDDGNAWARSHGATASRVAAVRRGMASSDFEECFRARP